MYRRRSNAATTPAGFLGPAKGILAEVLFDKMDGGGKCEERWAKICKTCQKNELKNINQRDKEQQADFWGMAPLIYFFAHVSIKRVTQLHHIRQDDTARRAGRLR